MWLMPNVMATLPNIGGALCSTSQSIIIIIIIIIKNVLIRVTLHTKVLQGHLHS